MSQAFGSNMHTSNSQNKGNRDSSAKDGNRGAFNDQCLEDMMNISKNLVNLNRYASTLYQNSSKDGGSVAGTNPAISRFDSAVKQEQGDPAGGAYMKPPGLRSSANIKPQSPGGNLMMTPKKTPSGLSMDFDDGADDDKYAEVGHPRAREHKSELGQANNSAYQQSLNQSN